MHEQMTHPAVPLVILNPFALNASAVQENMNDEWIRKSILIRSMMEKKRKKKGKKGIDE